MEAGSSRRAGARGFTLLELVVVIAILAVLAGILTPIAKSAIDDSRATKIVAVYSALSKASQKYYFDTNGLAREYSDDTATTNRRFSSDPASLGVVGWKGPYLDKPLRDADNPFGTTVRLLDSLDLATPGAAGFDLLGTGAPNRTGTGNCVRFDGVPSNIARLVDETLDRGTPGTWSQTGTVEYDAATQQLFVFILDTDNA
ncbi:MAG TPA: prepilin-type N-terminal cleavage/methylation domain-containing protein [Planctomycetota bacterium]|nr:prepilin-type N-terminal cleavage/methylation domain-containing protein [Planctomycetota bacterium]